MTIHQHVVVVLKLNTDKWKDVTYGMHYTQYTKLVIMLPALGGCISIALWPTLSQTRSQAVARIADRTASQKTLAIIAIVLIGLAYYESISLI